MTPKELLAACMERIAEWDSGQAFMDEPTIALTLMRPSPPSGDTVRLYGRSGPKGRLANARPKDGAWQVVAYFPAVAIARDVAEHLGEEADLDAAGRTRLSSKGAAAHRRPMTDASHRLKPDHAGGEQSTRR